MESSQKTSPLGIIMMNSPGKSSLIRSFFVALGPAVIVASVVLGPGSILTNSKVGTQYEYSMIWVLILASLLMFVMATLSARLGVIYEYSFCQELSNRLGRPVAIMTGVTVFLIASCFQFTNNLGVLAAIEPMFQSAENPAAEIPFMVSIILLGLLNGLIIITIFGMRQLYPPLEKLMMILVGVMILVFVTNLFFAFPSFSAMVSGFVPKLPEDAESLLPKKEGGKIVDPHGVLVALMATTFSIAGAFYQGYLAKEKGWKVADLKQGMIDSAAGILVLGGISLVVMLTSASVLFGNVSPAELKSVSVVAQQLKPLLGNWGNFAEILFCIGIFAGAFSSFMVNAMIGGVLLSDGLGYNCRLDSLATKVSTTIALIIGMISAAIVLKLGKDAIVPLIIFGQGLTVIGGPVLAFALLYLATRKADLQENKTPSWMLILGLCGFLLAIILAIRTCWLLFLKLS